MPKMKTKSAAKKRFKITGTGKVLSAAAGKRHGMIKRSNKFIRNARGTMVLAEPDGKKVIKPADCTWETTQLGRIRVMNAPERTDARQFSVDALELQVPAGSFTVLPPRARPSNWW